MSLLPTGSTPWLIAHELKLLWRSQRTASGRSRGIIVLAVVGAALAFALGLPIAYGLSNARFTLTAPIVFIVDAVLLFLFSLMLSLTVSRTTQIFYERGDLDLLLSSPLPARRVLTARCAGMAMNAAGLYLLLASPVVLPTILFGHPEWLTVYPVLIALSLLATTIGLLAAMGLFALIGPRATKTLAQVLSAVIGAGFYLATQLGRFSFRQNPDAQAYGARMEGWIRSGLFAPDQPLAWPARALLGDPLAAAVVFGLAALLFLGVITALGGRFERDAAAAAGVGALGRKRPKGRVRGFTGGPFQAMLRKELRLMRRDVALISQVLLRVLYLVPTVVILWSGKMAQSGMAFPFLAAWVVFMTGQIGGSLAWITMSGEEGLELLASAPVRARTLRRAKLVAALIPLFWLLVLPIGLLAWWAPQAAAAAALGGGANAVSSGLIAIWYERPAPRSDFRRRRGGSLVASIADLILSLLWGGAAFLGAGALWPFAAAPVVLALVGLLALQRPQREFAQVLQAK